MSFNLKSGGLVLLAFASLASARGPKDNSLEVTLSAPVQIPETVLQPGKYTFDLEDRLADRAIVRITEPGGTQHYLLTVPNSDMPKTKGLSYISSSDAKVLRAWECPTCAKPLEFVYPKNEAVKLTASTGKSILAFDTGYDKLPDNMSPDDRKVVTLWMLSPKRVTADGHGEGLTAAKYAKSPQLTATNSQEPPKRMPKTAGYTYLELAAGLTLLLGAALLKLCRFSNA